MATKFLRIGTRESPLAVWQAKQVQSLLAKNDVSSELIFIKSEGDKDLVTPLYAIGVQGIFTKTLDAALLNNRIDIAVHSLKDVPVQMAEGIAQAAVLKRGSYKDIFVYKQENDLEKLGYINNEWVETGSSSMPDSYTPFTIATSSIRRIAQWLNRYPNTAIENLRGNVNTRLHKVEINNWNGAIFAAAGVERINIRPKNSVDLDWMLPAPAQGAIAIVCKKDDTKSYDYCQQFNDKDTAMCVKIERDFLKTLYGGCSTPISALAVIKSNTLLFKGSVLTTDGKQKIEIEKEILAANAIEFGIVAGEDMLAKGADKIIAQIRNAAK